MSSGYEQHGRVRQKARTREALVEAARSMLSVGITPTVEQAAASASVSRPTAYRYFPSQQALLSAAHPELSMESLLPEAAPTDAFARLDLMSKALVGLLLQHETALRAMWRVSLEQTANGNPPLALRTGRRIRWVDDALAPLRDKLESQRYQKLVLQIAATLGIEPLIWLIDIAHLERKEAGEILQASARALLRGSL